MPTPAVPSLDDELAAWKSWSDAEKARDRIAYRFASYFRIDHPDVELTRLTSDALAKFVVADAEATRLGDVAQKIRDDRLAAEAEVICTRSEVV